MSDLLCLFMVVMANMVVWVLLTVVGADIVTVRNIWGLQYIGAGLQYIGAHKILSLIF